MVESHQRNSIALCQRLQDHVVHQDACGIDFIIWVLKLIEPHYFYCAFLRFDADILTIRSDPEYPYILS